MLPLALTMGEPAGIGGEITLKAWTRRYDGVPPFFALDDPDHLQGLALRLGLNVPIRTIEAPEQAKAVYGQALPVLPHPLAEPAVPGQLNPANAQAIKDSIEAAVRLTREGRAAAVVTNPVNKQVLYDAGFPFPGHTEYLANLAAIETRPVMMLACEKLKVVPVTIHVSLREAIEALDSECIVETAEITAAALRRHFGAPSPRLAIAGLNPHAGEGGGMGHEEIDFIIPAIRALNGMGIAAFGPVPSDTMFTPHALKGYDAAICMYHDQALIPIKTIDFDGGVNVTLGLPFVRTSPDHGTAIGIAGTGRAKETSLIAALRMAAGMADQ